MKNEKKDIPVTRRITKKGDRTDPTITTKTTQTITQKRFNYLERFLHLSPSFCLYPPPSFLFLSISFLFRFFFFVAWMTQFTFYSILCTPQTSDARWRGCRELGTARAPFAFSVNSRSNPALSVSGARLQTLADLHRR